MNKNVKGLNKNQKTASYFWQKDCMSVWALFKTPHTQSINMAKSNIYNTEY